MKRLPSPPPPPPAPAPPPPRTRLAWQVAATWSQRAPCPQLPAVDKSPHNAFVTTCARVAKLTDSARTNLKTQHDNKYSEPFDLIEFSNESTLLRISGEYRRRKNKANKVGVCFVLVRRNARGVGTASDVTPARPTWARAGVYVLSSLGIDVKLEWECSPHWLWKLKFSYF